MADHDRAAPDPTTPPVARAAGEGPRICVSATFALQEAVIILATLLARFRFAPVAGLEPKPVMILTLRPEGGVWLVAERV